MPLSLDAMAMVRYYIGASADGGGAVPTLQTNGGAYRPAPGMHPDLHYASGYRERRDYVGKLIAAHAFSGITPPTQPFGRESVYRIDWSCGVRRFRDAIMSWMLLPAD